jgi:uncharacterized protein
MRRPATWLILAGIAALTQASPALALRLALDPPGQREFIRDLAGMISDGDKAEIRRVCDKLLTDKATPVIVVTIESMARCGGADLRIETFAQLLFDQWGIGQPSLEGQPWNTGILLLVSRDDRKARIQLGAGWHRDKDAPCLRIMDCDIIPFFKRGDFSAGILRGVRGLDKMARADLTNVSQPPASSESPRRAPAPTSPWWSPKTWCGGEWGFGALAMGVVMLLGRFLRWVGFGGFSGGGRYGSGFFGGSGGSSFGGGFSGGSFGGGSSGGGGATGSW